MLHFQGRTIQVKMLYTAGVLLCMVLCLCACTAREKAAAQAELQTAPQEAAQTEPLGAQLDLDKIVESIKLKDGFKPEIGIVLGSGLHPLADEVDVVQTIAYEDIPGFPHSTVEGHQGRYILGYLKGVPVILMDGRIHYYEGYTMEQVVTPDSKVNRLSFKGPKGLRRTEK